MSVGEDATASATVLAVYERLLDEILSGARRGGDLIRDRDVALEFGVSRTPVREAIQMLRNLGIVEASASRYTRVARFGTDDIVQSLRLLFGLYREVIREVLTTEGALPLAEMEASYASAVDADRRGDEDGFWPRIFAIHDVVFERCGNPHLGRAVKAVLGALRVAVVTNRERLDRALILAANRDILDALHRETPGLEPEDVGTLLRFGERLTGRPVVL